MSFQIESMIFATKRRIYRVCALHDGCDLEIWVRSVGDGGSAFFAVPSLRTRKARAAFTRKVIRGVPGVTMRDAPNMHALISLLLGLNCRALVA